MTLRQIARLGRHLMVFLVFFRDCFGRPEPRELLRVYIQGQLSNVHRKTAEGIALQFGTAPRTLQRFLESIFAFSTFAPPFLPPWLWAVSFRFVRFGPGFLGVNFRLFHIHPPTFTPRSVRFSGRSGAGA